MLVDDWDGTLREILLDESWWFFRARDRCWSPKNDIYLLEYYHFESVDRYFLFHVPRLCLQYDVCPAATASIIKIIYHIILEFVVTSTCQLVMGPIPGNDKHSSFFFPRPGKNSASNERDDNDDDHEGKILKNIIYLYIYNHGNVIAFEPEETRRAARKTRVPGRN